MAPASTPTTRATRFSKPLGSTTCATARPRSRSTMAHRSRSSGARAAWSCPGTLCCRHQCQASRRSRDCRLTSACLPLYLENELELYILTATFNDISFSLNNLNQAIVCGCVILHLQWLESTTTKRMQRSSCVLVQRLCVCESEPEAAAQRVPRAASASSSASPSSPESSSGKSDASSSS